MTYVLYGIVFLLEVQILLLFWWGRRESAWHTGMLTILYNMITSLYEDYKQRMERLGFMTRDPEKRKDTN